MWQDLSIHQKLNTMCDALAKGAVTEGMTSDRDETTQLLPREQVALFMDGKKQISNCSSAIRFLIGLQGAHDLYVGELGWPSATFSMVDWPRLYAVIESKGRLYQNWYAKQVSGFCGTQKMVSRWDSARDDKCPDCGLVEDSSHLLRCPDHARTRLLHDLTDELLAWMDSHHSHEELTYWMGKFILLRNTRTLFSFLQLSPALRAVASDMDSIGWQNVMEGKPPHSLVQLQ